MCDNDIVSVRLIGPLQQLIIAVTLEYFANTNLSRIETTNGYVSMIIWLTFEVWLHYRQLQKFDGFERKLSRNFKGIWCSESLTKAKELGREEVYSHFVGRALQTIITVFFVLSGTVKNVWLCVHFGMLNILCVFFVNEELATLSDIYTTLYFPFALLPVYYILDVLKEFIEYLVVSRLFDHKSEPLKVKVLAKRCSVVTLLSLSVVGIHMSLMAICFLLSKWLLLDNTTKEKFIPCPLYSWGLTLPLFAVQSGFYKKVVSNCAWIDLDGDDEEGDPDGELRQPWGNIALCLYAVASRVSFPLSNIYIEHVSAQTNEQNAYFCPETDTIVLYDTLIPDKNGKITSTSHSDREIEATFAHELGHWNQTRNGPWKCALAIHSEFISYGFITYNGFVLLLLRIQFVFGLQIYLWLPLMFFTEFSGWALNYFLKVQEYDADRFAVKLGYTRGNMSSLIKSYREGLDFPCWDKVYSARYHTHPTLMERVEAIEEAMKEIQGKRGNGEKENLSKGGRELSRKVRRKLSRKRSRTRRLKRHK